MREDPVCQKGSRGRFGNLRKEEGELLDDTTEFRHHEKLDSALPELDAEKRRAASGGERS